MATAHVVTLGAVSNASPYRFRAPAGQQVETVDQSPGASSLGWESKDRAIGNFAPWDNPSYARGTQSEVTGFSRASVSGGVGSVMIGLQAQGAANSAVRSRTQMARDIAVYGYSQMLMGPPQVMDTYSGVPAQIDQ